MVDDIDNLPHLPDEEDIVFADYTIHNYNVKVKKIYCSTTGIPTLIHTTDDRIIPWRNINYLSKVKD